MDQASRQATSRATVRCRACCSETDPRASRCPHCARWRGWLAVNISIFVILLAMVGMWVPIGLFMDRLVTFGATGPALMADVHLTDWVMVKGRWGGQDRLAVLGRIRNQGPERRQLVQLEMQFRDHAGTLVDVATAFPYGSRDAGLLPRQQGVFHVDVQPDLPLDSYASCRVFVRSASPPSPFD